MVIEDTRQIHPCFHAGMGLAGQLADRHGAKAEVHAQVARALDGRKVTPLAVGVDALQKVRQQALRARLAAGDVQLREVGGLEVHVGQARHRLAQGRRARRQVRGVSLDRSFCLSHEGDPAGRARGL